MLIHNINEYEFSFNQSNNIIAILFIFYYMILYILYKVAYKYNILYIYIKIYIHQS